MKKIPYFLLSLWLLVALFAPLSHAMPEDPDKPANPGAEDRTSSDEDTPGRSLNNSLYNDALLRLRLTGNVGTGAYAVQDYIRGFKLNLMLIDEAFKLPPLELKPFQPRKRWGRTILEGLAHFVYATASYWIREDVMKEDWEYQFTWKDQRRRFLFLDGPRFDSNVFSFNWTHAMAGAIYYNYARNNRLTPLESFLFSTGASTFWEFVVEFKEMVSINDMISTPMGGLSIGEALFHLSRVFRDRRPTIPNKIASFFSNPVMTINNWLDRKKRGPKIQDGASQLWQDFRLFLGPRAYRFSGEESRVLLHTGVETQVMTLPEYGMPGAYAFSTGTLFTQFNLDAGLDKKGIYEFNIFAKSILFGYFNQNIHETDAGQTSGYSFFIGAGSAFDVVRKRAPTPEENEAEAFKTDQLCIINLLGPSFDLSLFHNDFSLRFNAEIYADFALVHSAAYQQYAHLHDFGNTKSTLKNHGYYYAMGFTTSSFLQVNYGGLELRGKFKYHYFDSIEGLDRFQKDMPDENDFRLKDTRFDYHVSVGYTIPGSSLQLTAALERVDREGTLEDFYREHSETRSYFQVKYLF